MRMKSPSGVDPNVDPSLPPAYVTNILYNNYNYNYIDIYIYIYCYHEYHLNR